VKLGYYPGCSADGSGVEYGLSTRRSAEIFGVDLVELEDWSCCGATSAHNTDKMLSLALPARNLAIAEQAGLNTILAPCAACYNRHRTSEHAIQHQAEMKESIAHIIDMPLQGNTTTISVLEWLDGDIGIEKIKAGVTNPLKGMKAACYYGCLLVRPAEHTGYDDPEDPHSMDRVVEALGARAVDWSHKTECCGAAIATSRPEIGATMIYEIIRAARDAGAECLITACPLCMLNLDMRQAAAAQRFKTSLAMPVYYVTELLAIACGTSTSEVGIHRHFVEARHYLQSLPEKAALLEEEEKKQAAARKATRARTTESEENPTAEKASPAEAAVKESSGQAAKSGDQVDSEAVQKKIDAMVKGWQKNPDKLAARLIGDEERARVLAEVVAADEKKALKMAELMITDMDKAVKAAQAFVTGELKKREKGEA